MAETDTTTQSPDDLFAQAQAIADRMRGQQQSYAPPAPVNRSIISLLGEAVGGGASDVAPADREAAGMRALLNFGANLSAASGPSVMPRNFGQILAQGVSGAEQSLGSSAAVSASRLAAQQAYEEKQQELQLEKLKTAIPLLTLQTQMQQAAAARGLAGNQPAPAPGTSISGVGAPVVPRDPNAGTAGQQANNPGNIMMAPGATVAGASGAIPVSGGRYVAAFPDVPTGVAAHSDLLTNYAHAGVGTIRDAVTRWVGDPKADLTSYVADVAKAAGVGPDDKVDLSDPKIQRAILLAQQPHESGKPWLSPADVDKGLALAAARRAAPPAATGGTQAPAPYKVASTGPTAPPAPTATPAAPPGSVAAETAGLKVPPGATPASTTPPAAPQYPDVTSGDVTIKHPGTFVDFAAKEMAPVPQTEDFNPNLTPAQQAAFAVKAQDLALKRQQIGTLPFADQPKAAAELTAQTAALAADQQNAAQEKAQKAAEATTKFQDTQRAAVQTRYDAAVAAYNEAAKSRFGFHQDIIKSQAEKQVAGNDEMLKPYEIAATQAGQVLPIISLAKQVLPELPTNASPWLADERNRARLESLAPFLPAGWTKATDGADLFAQVMSNIVVQMGANVQSGQTGGREAAYQEFRSMLPTLSQSAEGRERALMFMQEIAQRRLQEAEFLQSYRSDPANRDPTLGVPNMGAARSAMETALPPMLKLPPLRYNPNLPATDPKEAANQAMYRRYFASVPDGGRYIGYGRDEQGAAHPVARTKVKGQPPQIGLE